MRNGNFSQGLGIAILLCDGAKITRQLRSAGSRDAASLSLAVTLQASVSAAGVGLAGGLHQGSQDLRQIGGGARLASSPHDPDARIFLNAPRLATGRRPPWQVDAPMRRASASTVESRKRAGLGSAAAKQVLTYRAFL
jgi:hypothetical protein